MKKRKWTKNKLFNVFLSVPLISLPTLGLVSCGDKTDNKESDKKATKNAWKEEKIDVTYNSHKYEINYLEETPDSNKQVILFLHGIGSSWHEFESLLDVKGRNYTMIALDYPASGKSSYHEDTDETISIVMYAGVVKEFIKAKKLKDIILFGHSLGGGIAPLVMQDTTLSIKKGLLLAPFNPYAVQSFIDKLKADPDSDAQKVGNDVKAALDQLDADKKDASKTPNEVLNNISTTLGEISKNVFLKNPNAWYLKNLGLIILALTGVEYQMINYNIMVNELLDRNFAKTTLLNAFTANKDKLVAISGNDDLIVPIESVKKMKTDLGIPLTEETNFTHSPQNVPAAWDKVKKFIYNQVASLK